MKKSLILILVIVAIIILLAYFAFVAINKKENPNPENANLVTETETEKTSSSNSVCQSACDNYVDHCLTKVPNATHVLFEEGRESCMQECANWDNQKTSCIAKVNSCELMTTECNL